MKKFRIGIICALVFALTLGLTSALGEESSAFPSERDAFKSSFYIGETDQERPFFDVVLPEIVANIEENNTHSITPYYDALPRANNPVNFGDLLDGQSFVIVQQQGRALALGKIIDHILHNGDVFHK